MKAPAGVRIPTTHAAGMLIHPPPFSKIVSASPADTFGASTQRGISTAKKPRMSKKSRAPSTKGRCFAPKALKSTAEPASPMSSSVWCL